MPAFWSRVGCFARHEPCDDRDAARRGRDGRDDAHHPGREPAVERGEPDDAEHGGGEREWHEHGVRRPVAPDEDDERNPREPDGLGHEQDDDHGVPARDEAAEEVGDPEGQARAQSEEDGGHAPEASQMRLLARFRDEAGTFVTDT